MTSVYKAVIEACNCRLSTRSHLDRKIALLVLERSSGVKLSLPYSETVYVPRGCLSHSIFIILLTQGIDAEYVSLENVVLPHDEVDGTLGQDFYDRVSDALAARIRQCEPRVPVVTGSFPKLSSRF